LTPPASTPPRASITFDVEVTVPARGADICALAIDLDRFVAVEPTLYAAQWLQPGPPSAGARADVVGEIPFAVSLVRHVIGRPHGIAVLEELDPGRALTYTLTTARARGVLRATFADHAATSTVQVTGWILPTALAGQIALAPWRDLLTRRANRAIERGVRRAGVAVTS
jgi:hypothetical protein